eukprot:TCALIF_03534-PA protein Name:"Similar to serpinb1 Leukocyte elastase inhibitor (Xenopus tropicalis)" AED:0.31 eAED:0.33 QI:0/0.12/0/0.55/1/1/9/0/922
MLVLVGRVDSETIVVESDNGEKHAFHIPHMKFNQKKLEELKNRNRDPKQFIGASVLSSIAVVNDDDPEYMKQRYQKEYERTSQKSRQGSSPATTPTFKFYLYDDNGILVQENLSLHDIQQILLIQSKSFGLSQLQWLIAPLKHQQRRQQQQQPQHQQPQQPHRQPKKVQSLRYWLNPPKWIRIFAGLTTGKTSSRVDQILASMEMNALKKTPFNKMPTTLKMVVMTTNKPPATLNAKVASSKTSNINPPQFPNPNTVEQEGTEVTPAPYARTTESVPDTTHNGTWSWMDVTKREQLGNMPVSSSFNPIRGPMLPQITAKDLITDLVTRRPSPTVPMATIDYTKTNSPIESLGIQGESATEFGPLQTFQQVTSKDGQVLFTSQSISSNSGGAGPQTPPTIPSEPAEPTMNENHIEDHEHHPHHDENHHDNHQHHHEHDGHGHGHDQEPDSHDHGHDHEHDDHEHGHDHDHHGHHEHHFTPSNLPKIALPQGSSDNLGLAASTSHLTRAERAFVDVNNELGFRFYRKLLKDHGQENMVFSSISTTTSLAMVFLGSRGNTSWQLNEILRLDEMISFNPHLMFKNITDTLAESNELLTTACLKALLVDKNEDPLMEFYKARARYFYNGLIENVDYDQIEEEIKELINQMIFMKTKKRVKDFLGHEHPHPVGPMSFFGANFFHGKPGVQGDVEEMNFINLPRARRLVSVSSMRKEARLNACYHRGMDVSALELPYSDPALSLILILPGKQTEFIAGGLQKIESKLSVENWNELMTAFLPLDLDIQVPIFQHRSMLDLSDAVKNMSAKYAFDGDNADFTGINGGLDLYLSSILQLNEFRFDSVFLNEEQDPATQESEKEPKSGIWDLFGLSRNGRQTEGESQRFQLRPSVGMFMGLCSLAGGSDLRAIVSLMFESSFMVFDIIKLFSP